MTALSGGKPPFSLRVVSRRNSPVAPKAILTALDRDHRLASDRLIGKPLVLLSVCNEKYGQTRRSEISDDFALIKEPAPRPPVKKEKKRFASPKSATYVALSYLSYQ